MTLPKNLPVANEGRFALPLEYVTATGGILAKKGAGKSNTAVVIAEAMYRAGVPWVAIDPKGDWWGIRSSADGTGPGLPIVVFGGRHGDIPLEPTAGVYIADLVLQERLTCVLDVSEFSRADVRRFLLAFAERLYRQADAEPLHLFLEECHEYLPQMVRGEDAPLVGAWEKIVKQGRFKGLGVTLISQRSASVNKGVLTQVDTLVMMRTTSPQDRNAVKAWIDVHGDSDEVLATLPSLESGEAWVWAPEWNMLDRVRFLRRSTFDSGATPKVGETRKMPSTLADVDLGRIKEQMSDTIEKAKADDPKELRKKIVHLENQLKKAEQALVDEQAKGPAEIVHVEVPVPLINEDHLAQVATSATLLQAAVTVLAEDVKAAIENLGWEVVSDHRQAVSGSRSTGNRAGAVGDRARQGRTEERSDPAPRRHPGSPPVPRAAPTEGLNLGKGELAILAAVAQFGSVTREQLTVLLGYKRSSRDTYIQRLSTGGLVTAERGQRIEITDAGVQQLGDGYDPIPTGTALLEFWENKLTGGEQTIFRMLVDAYPDELDRDTISESSGYKRSSRDTYLQRLRTREIITVSGSGVRASELLFDA